MSFNLARIKWLGTIYRSVQAAIAICPSPGLYKTETIIGQQILEASQIDHIEGRRISIDCRVKVFPYPKYTIGNYVQFREGEDTEPEQGLIIGLSYHHPGEGSLHSEGWWYEINEDGTLQDDNIFIRQSHITKLLPPWESPENQGLNEEAQGLLDSFLDHLETKHGPFLPPNPRKEEGLIA